MGVLENSRSPLEIAISIENNRKKDMINQWN
jgi:hypothetical protein